MIKGFKISIVAYLDEADTVCFTEELTRILWGWSGDRNIAMSMLVENDPEIIDNIVKCIKEELYLIGKDIPENVVMTKFLHLLIDVISNERENGGSMRGLISNDNSVIVIEFESLSDDEMTGTAHALIYDTSDDIRRLGCSINDYMDFIGG